MSANDEIAQVILENLPRELVLRLEESLIVGAQKGHLATGTMHDGHRSNVLGQMRHFHMNEGFHSALQIAGAAPAPLRGNGVVLGTSGIVKIGRFNTSIGVWNTARRSSTRRQLAQANAVIQTVVQDDFFGEPQPITEAVIFFVSIFSGSIKSNPESPLAVEIAMPDRSLREWLFREPVSEFLARYNPQNAQIDTAQPTLKKTVLTKLGNNE
jgi:hypothetical protein